MKNNIEILNFLIENIIKEVINDINKDFVIIEEKMILAEGTIDTLMGMMTIAVEAWGGLIDVLGLEKISGPSTLTTWGYSLLALSSTTGAFTAWKYGAMSSKYIEIGRSIATIISGLCFLTASRGEVGSDQFTDSFLGLLLVLLGIVILAISIKSGSASKLASGFINMSMLDDIVRIFTRILKNNESNIKKMIMESVQKILQNHNPNLTVTLDFNNSSIKVDNNITITMEFNTATATTTTSANQTLPEIITEFKGFNISGENADSIKSALAKNSKEIANEIIEKINVSAFTDSLKELKNLTSKLDTYDSIFLQGTDISSVEVTNLRKELIMFNTVTGKNELINSGAASGIYDLIKDKLPGLTQEQFANFIAGISDPNISNSIKETYIVIKKSSSETVDQIANQESRLTSLTKTVSFWGSNKQINDVVDSASEIGAKRSLNVYGSGTRKAIASYARVLSQVWKGLITKNPTIKINLENVIKTGDKKIIGSVELQIVGIEPGGYILSKVITKNDEIENQKNELKNLYNKVIEGVAFTVDPATATKGKMALDLKYADTNTKLTVNMDNTNPYRKISHVGTGDIQASKGATRLSNEQSGAVMTAYNVKIDEWNSRVDELETLIRLKLINDSQGLFLFDGFSIPKMKTLMDAELQAATPLAREGNVKWREIISASPSASGKKVQSQINTLDNIKYGIWVVLFAKKFDLFGTSVNENGETVYLDVNGLDQIINLTGGNQSQTIISADEIKKVDTNQLQEVPFKVLKDTSPEDALK